MKRFFILHIFIYFTGLWLTGNVSGSSCSGNVENQARFSLASWQLYNGESHHISSWIDIFDKGENEENEQEDTSVGKKLNGINPFLGTVIAYGNRLWNQTFSFRFSPSPGVSFVVLYHAWKFHI